MQTAAGVVLKPCFIKGIEITIIAETPEQRAKGICKPVNLGEFDIIYDGREILFDPMNSKEIVNMFEKVLKSLAVSYIHDFSKGESNA